MLPACALAKMGTASINIADSASPINGANVCIKTLHLIASALLSNAAIQRHAYFCAPD
jgi:hypothetical protein